MTENERRSIARLDNLSINFDLPPRWPPGDGEGWTIATDEAMLPAEPPGDPVADGSFNRARTLLHGYPFADPAILRPLFDPSTPLLGRGMLLSLRVLGCVRTSFGVRIVRVIDERDGDECRWGWSYRTLRGDVEQGELTAIVVKMCGSGECRFRLTRIVRLAPTRNPLIYFGSRWFGPSMARRFVAYAMEVFPRMVARVQR